MDEYEEKLFLKEDFDNFLEMAKDYVPNAIKLREQLPPFHFGERPNTSKNQKKTIYKQVKPLGYESSSNGSDSMSESDGEESMSSSQEEQEEKKEVKKVAVLIDHQDRAEFLDTRFYLYYGEVSDSVDASG
jgi:hypothetical protein